jgi:hypothetical protein
VSKLVACALHVAVFATPQFLLFTDVAVKAWLGPAFKPAGPVIRITLMPIAMYVFYLVLRSALDAAAVKAYNSRNNLISLAVASIVAAISLHFGIGRPIEAIAASFAAGILCLGALTIVSVHSLYRLRRSEYLFRACLALSVGTAIVGAVVRLSIGSRTTLVSVLIIAAVEIGLGAVYLIGLVRAGATWPSDIRDWMFRRRPETLEAG